MTGSLRLEIESVNELKLQAENDAALTTWDDHVRLVPLVSD